MSVLNQNVIDAFFAELVKSLKSRRDVYALVVAHMVPNSLAFVPAVNRIVTVGAVLPKPKSTKNPEYDILADQYTILPLTREWARDPVAVVKSIEKIGLIGKDLIIVDIGGYFAPIADKLAIALDGHFLGILEGTENGIAKYIKKKPKLVPVVTVARSPLKLPEDYLVASSIVFSVEAVLREVSEILQTRSAAVLGYGRVGSAVADILRGRGINTVIYDNNPVQLAKAAARGFQAHRRVRDALEAATLVICATGKQSLSQRTFEMLRSGCVVASVTSADDEFELASVNEVYVRDEVSRHIVRYTRPDSGRYFLLVADGNAANFIHGAVIGPAIQLIEGEKLAAIEFLAERRPAARPAFYELRDGDQRKKVAKIWNEHFLE